jgi:iron complex outermembrane receptor protein
MNNNKFKTITLLAICTSSLVTIKGVAAEQEKNSRKYEIMEVTAQKKSEPIQTVPLAITTFSAQELKIKGIYTIEGLESNTPGFTLDELSTGKVRTAIRGIGSDNSSPGQEFSTVMFLNGIGQSTNGLAAINMFDIERVEVLKGPQGTLWGKGAIGGGINIITARPKDYTGGSLSLTVGNYGRFDVEGVLNLAESDHFRQRLALAGNVLDGYAENVNTGQKLEDMQRIGARYSFDMDFSDKTKFGMIFDYTKDDNNGRNYQVLGGTPAGSREDTWNQLAANRSNSVRDSLDDDVGFARRELFGVRAELSVDFDWATFVNVTSYRDITDSFFDNNDGSSPKETAAAADVVDNRGAEFGLGTSENSDQFSTEFRLMGTDDQLEWTVGTYFGQDNGEQLARFQVQQIDCRASNSNFTDGVPVGSNPGDGCTTGSFSEDRWNIKNTTDITAAFGEITYNISDAMSLTAGGRYSEYKKDYHSDNLQSIGSTVVSGAAGQSADVKQSWDKLTYRLIADYKISEELFAYASYATGFAPGDFAAFTSTIGTELTPQDAKSTEFGLKGAFDEWQFNTAIFFNDFSGTPVVQLSGAVGGIAGNSQEVTVNGFETDLRFAVTEDLFFDVKYAYLDTEADGTPFGDNLELQRAPENDLSVGVVYFVNDSIEVGGGYSYRSEVFDDPDNNLGEVRPSRKLLDLYAKWKSEAGYTVQMWGRNLTDENYVVRISDSFQSRVVNYGAPLTFGVSVSKEFW